MLWRNLYGFVALFVLASAQSHERLHRWGSMDSGSKFPADNLIDIDVENERTGDQTWADMEMSGSGSGMDVTDDEDLASGSGSGDIIMTDDTVLPTTRTPVATTPTTSTTTTTTEHVPPTPVPTSKRLTPCQQLREASQHLAGNFVPNCDTNGDYEILQCHGHPQKGRCFCADLRGSEIPGTNLNSDIPDCVEGKNLPQCVFQLVWQMRKAGMSIFRPQCTNEGDFESTQCKGTICYCVDPKSGEKVSGTEVFLPDRPKCDPDTESVEDEDEDDDEEEDKPEDKITLFPPVERTTTMIEVEVQTEININLEGEDNQDSKPDSDNSPTPAITNKSGNNREPVKEPSSATASMMTQPGILAAIIGGSVVLLLCAILLAMFIIYRMKKKDEGSYPLDEPKKMPNYSYQRAPEKEFYA